MRLIIDIAHPGHINYFKNFIWSHEDGASLAGNNLILAPGATTREHSIEELEIKRGK